MRRWIVPAVGVFFLSLAATTAHAQVGYLRGAPSRGQQQSSGGGQCQQRGTGGGQNFAMNPLGQPGFNQGGFGMQNPLGQGAGFQNPFGGGTYAAGGAIASGGGGGGGRNGFGSGFGSGSSSFGFGMTNPMQTQSYGGTMGYNPYYLQQMMMMQQMMYYQMLMQQMYAQGLGQNQTAGFQNPYQRSNGGGYQNTNTSAVRQTALRR